MFTEISAAVASAKVALDIAKAAHGLSNYNELVAAVSEVNAKLVDATVVTLASLEKQSALTSRVSELEEKLRSVENWESQMQRYELYQFATRVFAYAYKESMQNSEPPHYICATCVSNGKKVILQPFGNNLKCNVCSISMQFKSHSENP